MVREMWFDNKALRILIKINYIVFVLAIIFSYVSVWVVIAASLIWISTTVMMVITDCRNKKISILTIIFIVVAVSIILTFTPWFTDLFGTGYPYRLPWYGMVQY